MCVWYISCFVDLWFCVCHSFWKVLCYDSKYFFWLILSLFFLSCISVVNMLHLLKLFHNSWMFVLVFLPSFFSLNFSLGNFYNSIFMFLDSFISYFISTDEPLGGFLYFYYTVFISKISFWLLKFPYFCLHCSSVFYLVYIFH